MPRKRRGPARPDPEFYLTAAELAGRFGIHRNTEYRLRVHGVLGPFALRLGRRICYRRLDLPSIEVAMKAHVDG